MTRQPAEPSDAALRLEALREDLVAYLDGELSGEEAARIERLINEDPLVRLEVQRLAATWDWLDVLERPTVDEDFTRTTIEMVARSAVSEVAQQEVVRRQRTIFLAGLAVLGAILSAAAGYWLAFSLWTNPNRWLLEHYAVIENQDLYRHVESVAFLRMLKANGLFTEEEERSSADEAAFSGGSKGGAQALSRAESSPPVPQRSTSETGGGREGSPGSPSHPASPPETSGAKSPEEKLQKPSGTTAEGAARPQAPAAGPNRPSTESPSEAVGASSTVPKVVTISDPQEVRRFIAGMGPAEKYALRQKMERFQKLPQSEQERLIRLHQELISAPDSAELITVLQRYYQWFKLLTPAQRGEMEALKPEERIAWIRKTRSEMVAAAINRTLFNFPPERIRELLETSKNSRPEDRPAPEDVFVLMRFVEETAAQRGERLLDQLSPQERQTLVGKLNQLHDPQQRKEFLAITWLQWQLDHPDQSSVLTAQELDELLEKFSPTTQARLRALPRDEQLKRVSQWIRGSVFFRYVMPRVWADMRRPVSEQELSRFVEEHLSQEERAALLSLSPEEMQRELTRRYLRWRYPGVGLGWSFRGRGPERGRDEDHPRSEAPPDKKGPPPLRGPGFGAPPTGAFPPGTFYNPSSAPQAPTLSPPPPPSP